MHSCFCFGNIVSCDQQRVKLSDCEIRGKEERERGKERKRESGGMVPID